MARIFPFRGITYAQDQIGDLAVVMTQPYDKITPEMQDRYYGRHDKNFVRIAKGRGLDGDGENENPYTRANDCFQSWLADGTLVQDDTPCIYVYQTEFTVPGAAQTQLRTGFIALAQLQDFSEGGVKPHEQTFDGPKADRLKLMMTTGANFECIFMLYSDPQQIASRILEETITAGKPTLEVTTEEGETHRIWPVSDPAKIRVVTETLTGKELFIADGHHRYETAVNYMKAMRTAGRHCEGTESFENYMMTFVNMADDLTILPTHRLIGGTAGFDARQMLQKLSDWFSVEEFLFSDPAGERTARRAMTSALAAKADRNAFGFYAHGLNACVLLTLKEGLDPADRIEGPESMAYKRLDVVVLHKIIFNQILQVEADQHDEGGNVWFERVADAGMDQVRDGTRQAIFVLNPTRIEEVQEIAGSGEKMPQKSTDFYPKLLSGVVMNKLNYVD